MAGGGRIADLVSKLDALGSSEWRQSLCQQLAEKSLDLIDNDFKRRSNPYGDRWTSTMQPNPILQRTGALRRSFRIISVLPGGFTIQSTAPYSGYHQHGTKRLPVRAMTPTRAAGMPASWEREYDRVVVRFVRETMR